MIASMFGPASSGLLLAGQEPIQTPFGPVAAPVEAETPPEGAALAAPAPVEQAQGGDEVVPIELILDNQDIHQVIQIIGDTLGINYIVDPSVQGTVNINTAGTLRRSDLLPLLETILRINGATIIQTGNFYEIVPANTALRSRLPVQDDLRTLAPDDQFVIQILRMRFVAASEMAQLLTPYVSEGASILVHESGNILLLSERRRNLEKLLEIVDIFDTNVFEGERVRLFPIQNNVAVDLAADLETVFSGYALSQGSAIRFIAIERLNSVLVVSPNAAVFEEVGNWLERLDQPSAGIQNFVYKVQNAKAVDIERVLNQLYGTQVQISNILQGSAAGTATEGQPAQVQLANGQLGVATAFVPTGNVRIIADEINNSLVIQASAQEYAAIEDTIRQLDVLPRQVMIDAQIYEVVLDDSIALGLSATLQNRGTLQNLQTTASFAGSPPALLAQTFSLIGRSRELVAFVSAQENRSRVRTVSAPSILVSDNTLAVFQVGAEVPIPTSSAVNPNANASDIFSFAQTIQFRETGVIMNVTPQINDGGNVTLQISQEVSQAGPNTTSGLVAPVIGKSSIQSTVVVRDGQTIALGGFIRESNDLIRSRIPLLGRIPGLGVLFGSTSRSTSRTELIVLITPHVIRTTEDADLATEELKLKLEEIQEMLK